MRFAGRAAGVYDVDSLGLAGGYGQVGVADTPEKSSIFLFKAVLVPFRAARFVSSIAPPGALDAESHLVIEQDGQVGLQVAAEDFMHLQDRLGAELAASTLVSLGGIGKAIAEHDASFGERRQNDLMDVLRAGGEHERHFGERRKSRGGGVQQDVANSFASLSAARFAGDGDGEAVGAQGSREFLYLGALAAPVETFKGNKFSACGHVGDDSRRWKPAGAFWKWTAGGEVAAE